MEEKIKCKFCGSEEIIKYGFRKSKYRAVKIFKCKSCMRTFCENSLDSRMKFNEQIILIALDLRMRGLSLSEIKEHLYIIYGIQVSRTTILNWTNKFSSILQEFLKDIKISNSKKIHADETFIKIRSFSKGTTRKQKRKNWSFLWTVFDSDTRFMISSILSQKRIREEAREAFLDAKKKMINEPETVVTDGNAGYKFAFKKAFGKLKGPRVKHLFCVAFEDKVNNNPIERLFGSLRSRLKVTRGFDQMWSAKNFLKLWEIHYNYIRPHGGLG